MSVEIPEKSWFKIGEVARIVGVKPYVIRYWESEFRSLRPAKTKSRQRLFRRKDIELLLLIRRLLHEERFTIDGARRQLRELSAAGMTPADLLQAEDEGIEVGLTTVQRLAAQREDPGGDLAEAPAGVPGARSEAAGGEQTSGSGTLPLPLASKEAPPQDEAGPLPVADTRSVPRGPAVSTDAAASGKPSGAVPTAESGPSAGSPDPDLGPTVAALEAEVAALRLKCEALRKRLEAFSQAERARWLAVQRTAAALMDSDEDGPKPGE